MKSILSSGEPLQSTVTSKMVGLQHTFGPCGCSKVRGLTTVILSFWASLWVDPKELCKDFNLFIYWLEKWNLNKEFVCLFHQHNQQSREFNPLFMNSSLIYVGWHWNVVLNLALSWTAHEQCWICVGLGTLCIEDAFQEHDSGAQERYTCLWS